MNSEFFELPDGRTVRLAAKLPQEPHCEGLPCWSDEKAILDPRDWRGSGGKRDLWVPDRYDQGSTNSCTGHSFAGVVGASLAATGASPVRFSAGFNYGLTNGGRDEGAYCRDLVKSGKEVGLVPEAVIPSDSYYKQYYPSSAYTVAKRYRIAEAYQIESWVEYCSALTLGYNVYHGFLIGQNFRPDANGFLPDFTGWGGGHAMWSYDLVQHPTNGRWYGCGVNSWGTRWGKNGLCFFPESYFWRSAVVNGTQFYNLDAWAIRVVAEDPQEPNTPPKVQ
jgi:hypothetical protein